MRFNEESIISENTKKLAEIADLAILIVDVQNKYLERLLPEDKVALIKSYDLLLSEANQHKMPVILIETEYSGSTFGSTINEISKYANNNYLRITKKWKDSFAETMLRYHLHDLKSKNVVITGLDAPDCIIATIKSAQETFSVFTNPELINSKADYKPTKKTQHNKHKEAMRWITYHTMQFTFSNE